jgi:hypothetical protein
MPTRTLARAAPCRAETQVTSPPASEDAETGPGLAHALALMAIGAGAASVWWGGLLLYLLAGAG